MADFPTLRHILSLLRDARGKGEWLPEKATPATPPAPISVPTNHAPSTDLQALLIDFVVAQTGYPREIVDLDADLEADLGIDSIKKGQLVGGVGEDFDFTAAADL